MVITKRIAPCPSPQLLDLWKNTFGEAEANLETPQIDGSELDNNMDILYLAEDGQTLAGSIHATLPNHARTLCGLSGMCVAPRYRGIGLSRTLFAHMMSYLEGSGTNAFFLGTNNPIAAKLYASFGFGFLPGSNVMAKFKTGSFLDFSRHLYSLPPKTFQIVSGSPAMRIPIIPLVLLQTNQFLLDCNTGLFSSAAVTQKSCMGLYQKYVSLCTAGGSYFGALNENGTLGAVASIMPTPSGHRIDYFCCDSFSSTIPELLNTCFSKFPASYFCVSAIDFEKQACLSSLGFKKKTSTTLQFGSFYLPCFTYSKD